MVLLFLHYKYQWYKRMHKSATFSGFINTYSLLSSVKNGHYNLPLFWSYRWPYFAIQILPELQFVLFPPMIVVMQTVVSKSTTRIKFDYQCHLFLFPASIHYVSVSSHHCLLRQLIDNPFLCEVRCTNKCPTAIVSCNCVLKQLV